MAKSLFDYINFDEVTEGKLYYFDRMGRYYTIIFPTLDLVKISVFYDPTLTLLLSSDNEDMIKNKISRLEMKLTPVPKSINFNYTRPDDIFLVLSKHIIFGNNPLAHPWSLLEIIFGGNHGWMVWERWLGIEEYIYNTAEKNKTQKK